MRPLYSFVRDSTLCLFKGGTAYWLWLGGLSVVVMMGALSYQDQLAGGMIVTGLSDQVSWGVYIANFTYLVGVAAAAVMLVIPAYIFNRSDIRGVVLIGEGIAVAAATMSLLFVTVDLGRPDRIWHMIPGLGRFNWPISLLAWDVVVLSGYLALNIGIPAYILYMRYSGREPNHRAYFPWVLLAILWAISIHTVTAFLFSSNVARPFWHTAVLGPRFLASAFTSGPALIILALQLMRRFTALRVPDSVISLVALIVTVALQINLFLLGVELFTEFYFPTEESASATFLYFGINGYNSLVPWIWSAFAFNVIAVIILTIHRLRKHTLLLNTACVLAVVGVWIEKGMGLIIPGFIPTPIGELFDYYPTTVEITVSLGIWAFGLLLFTLLAKAAVAIETGTLRADTPGVAHRQTGAGHDHAPVQESGT